MVPITTLHYLVVAAALFVLGTIGVLTRRNVVIVLMSIELILNAVNLNLVAFSRLYGLHGQVFAIFVITDAAAEAAVGLGILIAFFRNKETVNVDQVTGAGLFFFFGRNRPKPVVSPICVGAAIPAFILACGAVWQYTSFAQNHNGAPFEKVMYPWLGSDTGHLTYAMRDGRPAEFK